MPRFFRVVFTLLGGIIASPCLADGPPPPVAQKSAGKLDFNRHILPILSENCYACHGPDAKTRKAELRLDTKAGLFGEGKSGATVIVPGTPDESELFIRLTAPTDDSSLMPPAQSGKKLKPEQIDTLRRWIEQGAAYQSHWAYTPPQRPSVPPGQNPIDSFIQAQLRLAGLTPNPKADKITLIRRVTLDLTGLPPSPQEVDVFLADTSANAYEKVVDRLLASPRFGEHRARYWLDAARYGDTHGLHLDNYREIWPFREWVIRAFNDNKPFDQFILEQIAGDLLPKPTLDQLVATGFNRCHVTTSEGGSIAEEVYVRNVVDRVDTTGTVFLGLTVGCARCHDHKYDPVTQKDYYSLFAYFNSMDGSPLDGNKARHAPIAKVADRQTLAELERLQARVNAAKAAITAEVKNPRHDMKRPSHHASLAGAAGAIGFAQTRGYDSFPEWLRVQQKLGWANLPRNIQNPGRIADAKRTPAQVQQLRDYFIEQNYAPARQRFAELHRTQKAAEQAFNAADQKVPTTLIFKELPQPKPAFVLNRGEYDQRTTPAERSTPGFLPPLPSGAPQNRLGFARWLIAPEHPLTARVAVNRFWQSVFGTGIVRTTDDFGSQGEPPSHPQLLDWLAVEFRETGWDVKKLMRWIVTSSTYQQSAKVPPEKLGRDPANRLLSRGPRFRLDGETIRDQALFLSGLLHEKIGGPSVKPPQPAGLWEAVGYTSSNTAKFQADTGNEKVHRRSLYTFWKRTSPPPQMTVVDAPSREACVVRRERTNTPLQALLLMNEEQFVECARGFAERALASSATGADGRLTWMFREATLRLPTSQELAVMRSLLTEQLAVYRADPVAAKKLIAVGVSQPNPQLPPDELAAYTLIGNLILNLDEVLNK